MQRSEVLKDFVENEKTYNSLITNAYAYYFTQLYVKNSEISKMLTLKERNSIYAYKMNGKTI
jgi:hypothetical protein